MSSAAIQLSATQKDKIKDVVGHDLSIEKVDLGNVGGVTLHLSTEQQKIVAAMTGKQVAVVELTEQDLKKLSSVACYEQGGIVVTPT